MEEPAGSKRKGALKKKKEFKIRRTWIIGYLQGAWEWGWDFSLSGKCPGRICKVFEDSSSCLKVVFCRQAKGWEKQGHDPLELLEKAGRRKSWWGKVGRSETEPNKSCSRGWWAWRAPGGHLRVPRGDPWHRSCDSPACSAGTVIYNKYRLQFWLFTDTKKIGFSMYNVRVALLYSFYFCY